MSKNFLAYDGDKLAIEWYFDSRGKSEALQYFLELPISQKKKFVHLFSVLGDVGKIFNIEKFRYEGNQIYALKSATNRFLCFFYDGSKIIITSAYEKKMAKMPQQEKLRALKIKADYIKRCELGIYYGK